MNLRLLFGYLVCLVLFAPSVASLAQEPSLTPSVEKPPETKPEQPSSLDLPRLERSVRPSVIWITVFDRSGKLLRTETGFFISTDGRLITTAHAIEGGIKPSQKLLMVEFITSAEFSRLRQSSISQFFKSM